MLERFVLICGLTFTAPIFSQQDGENDLPPPCPKSGVYSTNAKERNYHCMQDWDPCTLQEHEYWLTWPLNDSEPVWNKVPGPMWGSSKVFPGTYPDWGHVICDLEPLGNGYNQGYLKTEWKVFDRVLFEGDQVSEPSIIQRENGTDIINSNAGLPSFTLYNTRTSVLRTFVLIAKPHYDEATSTHSSFFADGQLVGRTTDPLEGVVAAPVMSGYALLENGLSSGLPLSKAASSRFNGWSTHFKSGEPNGFWWVIDQVLPYNEWDNYNKDLSTRTDPDLVLEYSLTTQAQAFLQLQGTMITQEQSSYEPPPGLFQGEQYSTVSQKGASGMPTVLSDKHFAVSGAVGNPELVGIGINALCSGLKNGFGESEGMDITSLALSGGTSAIGPLAGQLATNLFLGGSDDRPRFTWEESQISLNGTITSNGAVGETSIPLSRQNVSHIPFLFKGETEQSRSDIEIGLYTFRNSPRVLLKRVDYYADIEIAFGVFHRRFLRSEYFASIEDPTCDLVLNPTSGNHFVSLKMIPVLWNSVMNIWEAKGEARQFQTPDFYASGKPWFISSNQSLHDAENMKVGVEIAVELAGEENGLARPVLSQRVFDADLVIDPNPVYKFVEGLHVDVGLIPPAARVVPMFDPTTLCTVDYAIGSSVRNYVKRQGALRNTAFEIYTKTANVEYAGTDDEIYAEITTCNAMNSEQVWTYKLNIPHHDDFEQNAASTYVFSEPGEIGPIKRVRFMNVMPVVAWDEYPGWLLERFSVVQRKLSTGEVFPGAVDVAANTWLAGEYHATVLSGAEAHPGISFESPLVIYTYDVPGMENACANYVAREGAQPPALLAGAYTGIAANRNMDISGSHFGRSTSAIRVFLGDQEASVIRVMPEQVTVSVPPMPVGRYALKVVVNGLEATSPEAYVNVVSPESEDPEIPPTPVQSSFLSFDENPTTWHSSEAVVVPDTVKRVGNHGYSLSMDGEGYRVVRSKRFCATELKTFGTSLAVDVYIPAAPSNLWWLGEVALFVDAPSAGLYNSWQGNVQLTGLAAGAWHTVEIPLNVQTMTALAGTACDLEFGLVLNAANANEPYRFDNLRFTGPILNSSPPSAEMDSAFVCAGACLDAEVAGALWTPMTLNTTAEKWYMLSQKPSGWQASEMAGRTISINGSPLSAGAPFPAATADGKWFLRFSAGDHTWASWSWW